MERTDLVLAVVEFHGGLEASARRYLLAVWQGGDTEGRGRGVKLGDTAYIIYGRKRYKGAVEMFQGDGGGVWVLVPELNAKKPFHRPPSEVYTTSRECKEALQQLPPIGALPLPSLPVICAAALAGRLGASGRNLAKGAADGHDKANGADV